MHGIFIHNTSPNQDLNPWFHPRNTQFSGSLRCGPIFYSLPPTGHKILPVLLQRYLWTLSPLLHSHGPWLDQDLSSICSYLVSIHWILLSPTSRITFLKISLSNSVFIDFFELLCVSRTKSSPPAWLTKPSTLWLLRSPAASPVSIFLFLTSLSTTPRLYSTLRLWQSMSLALKTLPHPQLTSPGKFLLILQDSLNVIEQRSPTFWH